MQTANDAELLADQPVEGEDLTIVCVTAEHQVDPGVDGSIPAERPVVEQHLEACRFQLDIGEFTADLVFVFGIVDADQL